VAGAVILPADLGRRANRWLKEVRDSKLLDPGLRAELAEEIPRWALAHGIGIASVEEIDRINIYHASHLAMMRAIGALGRMPDHVLVDGNRIPSALKSAATAVVKGDQKCLSIACASVLAKVARDRMMVELETEYPGYGFAVHKGYPTPQHAEALARLGATSIHRRSFGPVMDQLAAQNEEEARLAVPSLPGLLDAVSG
jgi:ribonuclease HII